MQGEAALRGRRFLRIQSGGVRFLSLYDGRRLPCVHSPLSYPIPHDGPVGRLLGLLDRHPYRPAHIHFIIEVSVQPWFMYCLSLHLSIRRPDTRRLRQLFTGKMIHISIATPCLEFEARL